MLQKERAAPSGFGQARYCKHNTITMILRFNAARSEHQSASDKGKLVCEHLERKLYIASSGVLWSRRSSVKYDPKETEKQGCCPMHKPSSDWAKQVLS